MIVATDRGVEFFDRSLIQPGRVLLHPAFKLRVIRLVLFDVIDHGIAIEAKAIDHHLIVTFAGARISRGEFADVFEREFEPEPRQVQNA